MARKRVGLVLSVEGRGSRLSNERVKGTTYEPKEDGGMDKELGTSAI